MIGVPWIVVAKTDTDEVMQPLRRKIKLIVAVLGATLLLAALLLIVLWRGQTASQIAFRNRLHEDRQAVTEHFARLTRLARDMVLLIDPGGRIVEANASAIGGLGYSAGEIQSVNVRDLRPADEFEHFERRWPQTTDPNGVLFEAVVRRKDGSTFPAELSVAGVEVNGAVYRQAFIRDITQRKRLEREVVRLTRVQRGLQVASSILLRAESESDLYRTMCNALIELGSYRMAAVALANQDAAKTFRYGAIAGVDDGYLELAGLSWGDGPGGKGPTGIAFRTGEVQFNQDFENNLQMSQWRDAALQRGYRASISLPLRTSGTVFGVLIIYAAEANAFNGQEVSILTEFAQDISYGVTFLRESARRADAERDVARLSKVNAALQGTTSVLLRARSEADIYQEICEVLVQLGGYRMADVATPNDDDGKSVRFVTVAGIDDGYLAQSAISWGGGPRSKGPTGATLRTGRMQINQDFANNATMAPWRNEAMKRGFRASIGLPINSAGRTVAALTIYAGEPHAFGSEEVVRLTALAEDISWAVAARREPPTAWRAP